MMTRGSVVGFLLVALMACDSEPDAEGADLPPVVGEGADCSGEEVCAAGLKCGAASLECLPTSSCLDSEGLALEGNCGAGFTCITDPERTNYGVCLPGGACDAEFVPAGLKPNVMILLDRSGSMDNGVVQVNGEDRLKWEVARQALGNVVTAFQHRAHFGLAVFSSCLEGQACSAGNVQVPVSASDQAIVDWMQSHDRSYLCESDIDETSIGITLDALGNDSTWQSRERENFVLLVTDGKDNCSENQFIYSVAERLFTKAPSISTYVIGFSDAVDEEQLSGIAASGGTGDYHFATGNLEVVLGQITAEAGITCDFTLEDQPPPTESTPIYIYFDASTDPLSEGAEDGWTYDVSGQEVTLHGDACQQLKSGSVDDVYVSYDCPRTAF